MKRYFLIICGVFLLAAVAQASTIKTSEDLIAAMRKK